MACSENEREEEREDIRLQQLRVEMTIMTIPHATKRRDELDAMLTESVDLPLGRRLVCT